MLNRRLRAIGLTRFVLLVVVGLLLVWLASRLATPGQDTTWQRIQQTGVWRVGMDPSFPPFEMLDEEGKPVGYDVELAGAMARRWGVELQIVAIGFDGLVDALLAGKVDSVVSALPHDPRLTEDVGYSHSYFEAGVRLVVADDSPVTGPDDLSGGRLAVEWGSIGDAQARKLERADPSIRRLTYPGPREAVDALVAGQADAVLIDGVTLRELQAEGIALRAIGEPLDANPYVIALPLDAHVLQTEINNALRDFAAAGLLIEWEDTWFSQTTDR